MQRTGSDTVDRGFGHTTPGRTAPARPRRASLAFPRDPAIEREEVTCAILRRDRSLRVGFHFLLLALTAGAVLALDLGEAVKILAEGLAFVSLVLALHFLTTPAGADG